MPKVQRNNANSFPSPSPSILPQSFSCCRTELRKGKGSAHKGRADEEGETVTTVTAQLSDIVGGDAGSAAFVLLPAVAS